MRGDTNSWIWLVVIGGFLVLVILFWMGNTFDALKGILEMAASYFRGG